MSQESDCQIRPGMRGYWITSLIFVGLGLAVLPFDTMLAHPENMEAMPGDLKRFVSLSEIFAHGFGVTIVAIGVWLLTESHRKYILRIIVCAAWPALGVLALKVMFARLRPVKYLDEDSEAHFPENISETFLGFMPHGLNTKYVFQSFVSAHAATAWGLAIGLSWVFPKGRILFFTIAIFASIQRVTSFAHWSSDVLFGTAVAFLMAGALTHNWGLGYYLNRFESLWSKKPVDE